MNVEDVAMEIIKGLSIIGHSSHEHTITVDNVNPTDKIQVGDHLNSAEGMAWLIKKLRKLAPPSCANKYTAEEESDGGDHIEVIYYKNGNHWMKTML